MNHTLPTILRSGLLAATFLLLAPAHAADPAKPAKAKPYPLMTCVVSGEKLAGAMGEPYVFTHDGREVKLCCKDCLKDFNRNPSQYVPKIDEAAKKVKPYPLETCLVSDEKLGGMGEPYVFIHEAQEIKLCCKGCLKEFQKSQAKLLKKLETARQSHPAKS